MITKCSPKLESIEALSLYGRLLDFLLLSNDPSYNRIVKFRKLIENLDNQQDMEELKAYFISEFSGFWTEKNGAWEYYKEYDK